MAASGFTVAIFKLVKYVRQGKITKFTPAVQTYAALMAYFLFRSISSLFFVINVVDINGFGKEYSLWNDDRYLFYRRALNI